MQPPEQQADRRNLELKARLVSLPQADAVARQLTGGGPQVQQQTDTYFHCRRGRLKLREIAGGGSQLIWYQRADEPLARDSHYVLAEVRDAAALKAALLGALEAWRVVVKTRRIYLWENVRIHLDDVAELGQFLEFEAVIGDEREAARAPQQLRQLQDAFAVRPEHLLSSSYSDMG